MEEISRNRLHDYAVQLMYSFLVMEEANTPIDFVGSISNLLDRPYEECDVFLKEVLIKCLKNEANIVAYIQGYLNKWDFKRLSMTIQAILLVAVTEYYLKDENIEKAVIINTSVKLTKKYGLQDEKDYKFVNAVLDHCLDERRENLLLN